MIGGKKQLSVLPALVLAITAHAWATVYDVGPGRPASGQIDIGGTSSCPDRST